MRLPVTLAAMAACVAVALASTPAHAGDAAAAGENEEEAPKGRQPLSGDPGWNSAVLMGAGMVMINTAGGQHYPTPELSLHGSARMSDTLTLRTIYDFSWRRDGTPSIYIDNTYSTFTPRFDLTYGTPKAQFVIGAGPSIILATTRIHSPAKSVNATDFAAGFGYGVGLRWMWGQLPWALDFGGQQRERRHDFRATISFGLPICASPAKIRERTMGK